MNKTDLVTELSHKMEITQKEATVIIDSFIETIIEGIKDDGRVCIMGFGSFRKRIKKARNARNPKTGEKIFVEEKITPHFTPGKELVNMVNGGR